MRQGRCLGRLYRGGCSFGSEFFTEATHQGYIESYACLAHMMPDGKGELWCTTQGHYNVQRIFAVLLGMETSQLRVTASEIGGGFGAKTTVFIDPVEWRIRAKQVALSN